MRDKKKDSWLLVFVALGSVLGGLLGFLAWFTVFAHADRTFDHGGPLPLIAVLALVGGGLLGGGGVAMLIVNRVLRARRTRSAAANSSKRPVSSGRPSSPAATKKGRAKEPAKRTPAKKK